MDDGGGDTLTKLCDGCVTAAITVTFDQNVTGVTGRERTVATMAVLRCTFEFASTTLTVARPILFISFSRTSEISLCVFDSTDSPSISQKSMLSPMRLLVSPLSEWGLLQGTVLIDCV